MKKALGTWKTAVTSVILPACVTLSGCGSTSCGPDEAEKGFDSDDVLVIAHRGGAGLWPENTLFAFHEAVALGVDVLEMDLAETRDGVLIIIHDETVDRTTDGTGPVDNLTLAEIQSLDAGYRWTDDDGATFPYRDQGIIVPTLEDVLAEFPGVLLNIEIKSSNLAIADAFCDMIRAHDKAEEVLVVANDLSPIDAFRDACPEVATAASESEAQAFFISTFIPLYGDCLSTTSTLQLPEYSDNIKVVTPAFVAAVHRSAAMIHVWTVNETADMRRFLDLGVDGIISDFPDRLLTLLDRTVS
ncbi:MAG: glycerophosphodiester phosphodiesterase [Planctomycetota bacterium]|jgi:glycerophosphoryl diester phosphodiesterase